MKSWVAQQWLHHLRSQRFRNGPAVHVSKQLSFRHDAALGDEPYGAVAQFQGWHDWPQPVASSARTWSASQASLHIVSAPPVASGPSRCRWSTPFWSIRNVDGSALTP